MNPSHEIIDWQGINLSVDFRPEHFGPHVHHLEIHVLQPEGAALPITDTGYRSHFFSGPLDGFESAAEYVRRWLDSEAQSPQWKQRELEARQLRLF